MGRGNRGQRRRHSGKAGGISSPKDDIPADQQQPTAHQGDEAALSPTVIQLNSNDDQHRVAERFFWRQQIKVATSLNMITAAAAGVGAIGLFFVYLGLLETKEASRIANKSLIASTRAWLAPLPVLAPQNFVDQKIEMTAMRFGFENVGKEPAININEQVFFDTIDADKFRDDSFLKQKIRGLLGGHACADYRDNPEGRTAFPGAKPYASGDLDSEKVKQVLDKTHYAFIAGCLVYRTMDEIHWTEFCSILVAPHRSNEFKWQNALCSVNQHAT